MKRIGYIYEEIISVENCRKAIINAAKKKKRRKSVDKVLDNLNYYANELSRRIKNKTFVTPYHNKTIRDGLSGKVREIQIPSFFPDQCAHHAIMQIVKPIIENSAYYWSCANIPGRGIDRACIGVERATKKDVRNAKYCVKMDIKKFYPSIPHDKLKIRVREKIKDDKVVQLIDLIIDSHSEGLPIGNYTSPWLAELYLQPLDYYIKQELKVIHHIRFADDIVMLGSNKRKLGKSMYRVIAKIESLGLTVKGDYQLFRVKNSSGKGRKIDFVGRCFAIGYTTIRKRRALAVMKQSRRIKRLQANGRNISYREAAGFISRSSCYKHTNSNGMKNKYYDTIDIEELKEVIRNESKRQCNS